MVVRGKKLVCFEGRSSICLCESDCIYFYLGNIVRAIGFFFWSLVLDFSVCFLKYFKKFAPGLHNVVCSVGLINAHNEYNTFQLFFTFNKQLDIHSSWMDAYII